jgi:hypothetical protein
MIEVRDGGAMGAAVRFIQAVGSCRRRVAPRRRSRVSRGRTTGIARRALSVAAPPFLALFGFALAGEEPCVGFLERVLDPGGINGVQSVYAADLDGDGDLDVVTASLDDKIAWYENDGADVPVFSEHVISATADGAASVFAADVDGDGDMDVLSASSNDDTVAWYENSGTTPMVFFKRVISATADLALSVFAADVDGDGDTDVLAASFVEDTISWYENGLSDPLAPAFTEHFVTASARGVSSVHAADLDGDGDLDVLSASVIDDTVAWYEAVHEVTGEGEEEITTIEFTEHEISTTADGAKSVSAADLDGDGDLDVLSASINDGLAWYEGELVDVGAPNDPDFVLQFEEHEVPTGAIGAKSVSAADLNADGLTDILLASEQANTIAWYENDGGSPPGFVEHTVTTEAESVDAVLAADMNGDGDTDILFAGSVPGSPSVSGEVAWYESDGGAPAFTKNLIEPGAVGANSVFPVDLDGDSDTDLLFAGFRSISWRENTGAPPPEFPEHVIASRTEETHAVHAADVDSDGNMDVISASSAGEEVAWYENDGATPPGFVEHPVSVGGDSAEGVHAADVDGDGDLDILSASTPDDRIVWYENDGGVVPGFVEHLLDFPGANAVFSADVNGDGHVDILGAAASLNKIAWYENDGAVPPSFVERVIASSSEEDEADFQAVGVRAITAADLDGDGDTDVLAASAGDDTIAWYQNAPDPVVPANRVFTENVITDNADVATSVAAVDVDGDGDLDVLAGSFADSLLAWYENDGAVPPTFTPHGVANSPASLTSVAAADIDGDSQVDLLATYRIDIGWYGQFGETCDTFDATGDDQIDGAELAWLVRAFGRSVTDPVTEWWAPLDFNQDQIIDGLDLSILASSGVWGASTSNCRFVCQ